MVRPRPLPPYLRVIGAVGLREGVEDALLTLERDADAGVRDRHMQDDDIVRRRLFSRDAKNDLALLGELDRVPEQIDENLTQASGVASDRIRHGRTRRPRSIRGPSAAPAAPPTVRRVADGVAEVEVDRIELELAGLHPGEVQDVVDDGQQRRRRTT